jgi:hypothetical protein
MNFKPKTSASRNVCGVGDEAGVDELLEERITAGCSGVGVVPIIKAGDNLRCEGTATKAWLPCLGERSRSRLHQAITDAAGDTIEWRIL